MEPSDIWAAQKGARQGDNADKNVGPGGGWEEVRVRVGGARAANVASNAQP